LSEIYEPPTEQRTMKDRKGMSRQEEIIEEAVQRTQNRETPYRWRGQNTRRR
jgi:hypothetical protein